MTDANTKAELADRLLVAQNADNPEQAFGLAFCDLMEAAYRSEQKLRARATIADSTKTLAPICASFFQCWSRTTAPSTSADWLGFSKTSIPRKL